MKWLLIICFTLVCCLSFAQQDNVKITAERNDDNTVTFFYEKNDPGSYVIYLYFNTLVNASSSDITQTVKGTKGTLFTLRPIDSKKGIGYGYGYRYLRGVRKAKVDKSFVYLLPYKNEASALVKPLNNISEKFFNKERDNNWAAYQFIFQKEDTICAIRKGKVVDVIDKFDNYKEGLSYSTDTNFVLVEHKDGSLAKYSVLRKGRMMVKKGDMVYPQTPIGVSGSYQANTHEMRLLLYYLSNAEFKRSNNKKTGKQEASRYTYINPLFYDKGETHSLLPNTTYTSSFLPEIIEKEMSKRERKRMYKK
ncbi:hypothetical protein D1816_12835 [Aquimarina sp. AD10]|uniref:peptidoglycan DD-metalloendopeptidase family protein n=1 Tax=Aquimarina sp. AD10 TaxID=1714849 RepID=UPI000E4B2D2F|nr:peptidoglycan DD-metalloendopeptidase family protein [Aquimarina sp. AD10]AXT61195.1 hypothetical protein D1816_12835 [Aquimarina sp. AD10]RKN02189.1 hypothetical protein D7033_01775 [Aquimarina sp. AD10]